MKCGMMTLVSGLLLAIGTESVRAQPLGTAFTYQGELRSSGTPAAGPHDLRFRLYDAASGGTQIGSAVCSDNVAMSEGRFTVVLDFGAQFTGQQRFLEIEVRIDTGLNCAEPAGFVPLTPRQPLTASPHAIFALNAGDAATAATATTALNATNAGQLNGQPATFYQNATNLSAGTIPSARLSGTYAGVLTLNNAGNSFTGSGGGLTGLNASNIASGTLADGRLAPTYTQSLTFSNASNWFVGTFTGGGAGLTNLHATNITSGTLSSSRLEVPLALSGAVTGGVVHAGNTSATGDAIGVVGASFSDIGKGVYGYSFAPSGSTIGVEGRSLYSPTGTGVVGNAIATGGWFEASGGSGTGLFGVNNAASGATYGIQARVASNSGIAIRGEATATTSGAHGVLGVTHSPSGIGVWGTSDATSGTTAGVYGSCDSTGGTGVDGRAWATTGTPIGVRGGTSGAGGYGVLGYSTAATGNAVGVKGEVVGGNTTGTGVVGLAVATGGWFEATGTGGGGLYGVASSLSGATRGVYGSTISPIGHAIHGYSGHTSTGYGVYGESAGSEGIGVVGYCASGSGFGVYCYGDFAVSGSKAFRIDHPADPENKYLVHYSTESPEVLNFYSGKVVLDGGGSAVVELPPYFARINRDPRYLLTPIGAPMPMLHVAEEIDETVLDVGTKAEPTDAVPTCFFRIAGGAPGAKVSWRVEAARNDRWMQRHGAPVDVEKNETEKGTYQHPDLYGQPAEKSMNHEATRERLQP